MTNKFIKILATGLLLISSSAHSASIDIISERNHIQGFAGDFESYDLMSSNTISYSVVNNSPNIFEIAGSTAGDFFVSTYASNGNALAKAESKYLFSTDAYKISVGAIGEWAGYEEAYSQVTITDITTGHLLLDETFGDYNDVKDCYTPIFKCEPVNGVRFDELFNVSVNPNNLFELALFSTVNATDDGWYNYLEADLDISPVPIPAAAWLFGSALICLASFQNRKKLMSVLND